MGRDREHEPGRMPGVVGVLPGDVDVGPGVDQSPTGEYTLEDI